MPFFNPCLFFKPSLAISAFFRSLCRIFTLCLLLTLTVGCAANAVTPIDGTYRYKSPSADGIGKVYYGREIANVMGYQGANWLARPSRTAEERSDYGGRCADAQAQ